MCRWNVLKFLFFSALVQHFPLLCPVSPLPCQGSSLFQLHWFPVRKEGNSFFSVSYSCSFFFNSKFSFFNSTIFFRESLCAFSFLLMSKDIFYASVSIFFPISNIWSIAFIKKICMMCRNRFPHICKTTLQLIFLGFNFSRWSF